MVPWVVVAMMWKAVGCFLTATFTDSIDCPMAAGWSVLPLPICERTSVAGAVT